MSEAERQHVIGLITAARAGDDAAFGRIVESFDRALKGYILGRIPATMGAEVDDLAQETWLEVHRRLTAQGEERSFDPARGAFYTWLTTCVAKYTVRHAMGRARRRASRELPYPADDDTERVGYDPAAPEEQGPDAVARSEERLRLRAALFDEMFRLTFLCGGYPHQQLAFGYSKLLYGRAVQGDSRKVDALHGSLPLTRVCEEFCEAYCAAAGLDQNTGRQLRAWLNPLRSRATLVVEDLFRFSPVLLAQTSAFRGRRAGTLTLRDHYTARGFTSAIPDWCDKVSRRVRAVLGLEPDAEWEETAEELAGRGRDAPLSPGGCPRCKLREASPCRERLAAESVFGAPAPGAPPG